MTVSPTETAEMGAFTNIEISVVLPMTAKPGSQALISLSASNGKTIVGSNSFTISVAEQEAPSIKAMKVSFI